MMNNRTHDGISSPTIGLAGVVLAVFSVTAALPAAACDAVHASAVTGTASNVVVLAGAQAGEADARYGNMQVDFVEGDVHAQSVQVMVENGETKVIVNGEEIPVGRVQHKDGRIVILDDAGNELEDLRLFSGSMGDGNFVFAPGSRRVQIGTGRDFTIDRVFPDDDPRIMVGIHMSEPGPALRHHLGLEEGQTTLVNSVYEDMPAHEAGIEPYAVITAINGRTPANPAAMRKFISEMHAGERVRLSYIQAGETRTATVTVDTFTSQDVHGHKILGSQETSARSEFRLGLPFGDSQLEAKNAWIGKLVGPENEIFESMPEMENIKIDRALGSIEIRLDEMEVHLREVLDDLRETLREQDFEELEDSHDD